MIEGTRIEVEIADYFESYDLISKGRGTLSYELVLGTMKPIYMKQFIPPPTTLLALKLSHLCLSVNWRKTASDCVFMVDTFKRSLKSIIANPELADPLAEGGPNLKHLLQLRLRESVAANYVWQTVSPDCIKQGTTDARVLSTPTELQELLDWMQLPHPLFKSVLTQNGANPATDALSTPLLPIALSTKELSALPAADRWRVLIEIALLVASHYFLRSPVLSPYLAQGGTLSTAEIATEAYLLALESIFTRIIATPSFTSSVVVNPNNPHQVIESAVFRRWFKNVSLYDGPRQETPQVLLARAQIGIVPEPELPDELKHRVSYMDGPQKEPEKTDFLPIPSMADVIALGIPASDPLCNLFTLDLSNIFSTPPMMETLVERRRAEVSLGASIPEIPMDLWKMIISDHIGDHYTALQLSSCNSTFRDLISNDSKGNVSIALWERLLFECWDKKTIRSLGGYASKPVKFPKTIFKTICTSLFANQFIGTAYECPHCGEYHLTQSKAAWVSQWSHEHNAHFCPCEKCHDITGSWNWCKYHTVYFQ